MNSDKKHVLVVLTDQWCDWEASYAIAVINAFSDYSVTTIAIDAASKKSMGGITATVDYTIKEFREFDDLAMIIMPGGLSWEEKEYPDIADFIRVIREKEIPVAAICSATTFLCRNGFLDHVKHTGDSLELFLEQNGYSGKELYVEAQVVVDGRVITANETAAVEFAYEIFKILKIDSEEEIEEWFDHFQHGAVRMS